MNFYETICISKLYAVAFGFAPRQSINNTEIDVAAECLKKMADNNYTWTQEQKDQYKLLVDFAKEMSKG